MKEFVSSEVGVLLRIIIAVVLLAHGIGHVMGILQVTRVATVNPAWQGDSWLLSGALGTQLAQLVGVLLWGIALVGFVALAGVVMGWLPIAWWVPLAVGSSLASLAGLVLFPTAFPTFSTVGAAVVDAAVLGAVLWLNWTPSELTA